VAFLKLLKNMHHVFTSADRIPEGKTLDDGFFTSVAIMAEGKKPSYEKINTRT
jgi:hypothetical protein